MKKTILALALLPMHFIFAQQVGHTTITYNDPARTGGFGSGGGAGRQIQTEIYYPAATAGNNVPVLNGVYPVITFGHGFAMSWDAYTNIWDTLVKSGYIIAFPRTEGGLIPSPSHAEFGTDLAQVSNKLLAENTKTGSLFLNKINGNAAIMGHSMGGGATFLAAANNTSIKTIVGLAPAETTPSAISAAVNVSVPTLVFSGSADGVTVPANNHTPIYNGVTSACKYFLSVIGGAHCYFANSNFNCDLGEGTSSPNISITRAEQQKVTYDYLIPWLNYYLKEDCDAWTAFISPQSSDTRITPSSTCNNTIPTTPVITLGSNNLSSSVTTNLQWYLNGTALAGETNQTVPLSYGPGVYTVSTSNGMCKKLSAPYTYNVNSLEELAVNFAIYPNPAKEKFSIQNLNGSNFDVEVYNVNGSQMIANLNINTLELNVSDWAKGIYFIQLKLNDRNFVYKLIKE